MKKQIFAGIGLSLVLLILAAVAFSQPTKQIQSQIPDVKVTGPLPKLMAMFPLLKTVYKTYPEHCRKHGLPSE